VGIPVRKVPQVLKELTGVSVTQGALTQDALRQAEGKVGTVYRQLLADMAAKRSLLRSDGQRAGGTHR
jgi:hypothetical protein